MTANDDLKLLNLPADATAEDLEQRYKQMKAVLDPALSTNSNLSALVNMARSDVDGAYFRLTAILAHDKPPVATELSPQPKPRARKKKPPKLVAPAETVEEKPKPKTIVQTPTPGPVVVVPEVMETIETTTVFGEFSRRLKLLLSNQPERFTKDWWDINLATVNIFIVILIVALIVGKAVLPDLMNLF